MVLAGLTQTRCWQHVYTQKTIYPLLHARNIPAADSAAAWVLRPNARPAARKSARRVDMILLGCCVSGAGCVVLADWLQLTGSN